MATANQARVTAPRAPRQTAQIVDLHGRPFARYDGAKTNGYAANWQVSATGPNAEIGPDLKTLRSRHRQLAENNPWAGRAIGAIVTNTVGDGLRAQWQDPAVQQLWSEWWETPSCDADDRLDGYGLQALILRTVVVSGAVLIRRRPRYADFGLPVPLQLQILEPDFIDLGKSQDPGRGRREIVQGIELDAIGRRTAYWLYPRHPGEQRGYGAASAVRYDASDFAHVFRVDRPGQLHGVPWGKGAMTRLKMLDDYQNNQLERQRLAACFMGFRRIPDPTLLERLPAATTTPPSEELQPGALEDLPPGWDIEFASPPQPEDDAEFQLSVLRAVAAEYGIPYEVLTGDLSQVNFSSARMGWNEFGRNIETWRWQMLATQALRPIVRWFREAAALVGIDVRQEQPLWTAPARTMVDATREVPALIKAVRAGLLSMPQAIRQQGYDPDLLLAEEAAWRAKTAAAGVLLDTDPAADPTRQTAAPDLETDPDRPDNPEEDTP